MDYKKWDCRHKQSHFSNLCSLMPVLPVEMEHHAGSHHGCQINPSRNQELGFEMFMPMMGNKMQVARNPSRQAGR